MNPFDGKKVLHHVPYWSEMENGVIPPPVLVTLDPTHVCNLRCKWCNSGETISNKAGARQYTEEVIEELPGFLADWGVKAVCIAGGGEPMLHDLLHRLIERLVYAQIEVGLVTNGTRIASASLDTYNALAKCRWVGVSVDAGTSETYERTKGWDIFPKVIQGMRRLREHAPQLEITYKYLVYPYNILEMPHAAQIADDIGCTYFHARPAGVTWVDIKKDQDRRTFFARPDVELGVRLLNAIAENKWKRVKVVNTPGKFDEQTWSVLHNFNSCHAVGMTCAIQANGRVSLCCDRRGDPRVELCEWKNLHDITEAWGGPRHLDILRNIDLDECPRCTYAPHNRLYEMFVKRDDTCKNFI